MLRQPTPQCSNNIGANLTDGMYQGVYGSSKKHDSDLDQVIKRAFQSGVDKIIITAGTHNETIQALELCLQYENLYTTCGYHPTRCSEFNESNENEILNQVIELCQKNSEKIVAIGEFGLDYERTQFCDIEQQKRYFEFQLKHLISLNKPLFLHNRAASKDLYDILYKYRDQITKGGVIHSFDGTLDEALQFIQIGYFIGLNGCSMKTQTNLDVIKQLPLDKILVETDAPWCGIKPSHTSHSHIKTQFTSEMVKKEKWTSGKMVKDRNEPCTIIQICEVIHSIRDNQESFEELCEKIYFNTKQLFFSDQ
ncbi:unnamed protein product [Rotaria sp. Silwood2]|nr:unnamed protein product [Rotaria sp. Silwood2]CAF2554610.1 unnamed protein product [Rotaria sp. Silwood2]CAF2805129.1 unnamed protein product [Rotaria sp. Silwood2]CAF2961862.1 unnamed protein product [Rotaria sp. Silwood2]CAF3868144.1 unnamed protein product [Rotaria sp. Silwood2]